MTNKIRVNYSTVWKVSSYENKELFIKLFEFNGKDSEISKVVCVHHNVNNENKLIGFYFMKKGYRWKKLDSEIYHAYFVLNDNLNVDKFDHTKNKEIFRSESGARNFIRQKYKDSVL